MSETESIRGFCPQCGEVLNVPAQLSEFSCMYCGARLRREELLTEPITEPSFAPSEHAQADFDAAVKALPSCVRSFRGYQRKVTKNEFEPAFQTVSDAASPVFRQLSDALAALPSPDERLLESVNTLLDELELDWAANRNRNGARDDDKMVIAIFLVPAIRKLAFPISEDFCKVLQEEWVRRYPKAPFYLGSYDMISEGFRKKFLGLCFITTAVCEELGKPDDCEELTAFRAFRDGYLRTCPDGPALIAEYYEIAPVIVTCIDLASDRHETYRAIRDEYLAPCYEDLQNGRLADCKDRYVSMVRTLQKRFLS